MSHAENRADPDSDDIRKPPRDQILKWIGNKQRFAAMIASELPREYRRYLEPFLGTGAVLAAMRPTKAIGADTLEPLIRLWGLVRDKPEVLADHYETSWQALGEGGNTAFREILDRYNHSPNPGDLLVLSRSCYGGVVRFTKEGSMSTPMGPHEPLHPDKLRQRLARWQECVAGTDFQCQDYAVTLADAGKGDVVYCDPPYAYSQAILYGAQSFDLDNLWEVLLGAADRGAYVALSINGHRKNGTRPLSTVVPEGIFQREMLVDRGGCMLRRFQIAGETINGEEVTDRLLFSW